MIAADWYTSWKAVDTSTRAQAAGKECSEHSGTAGRAGWGRIGGLSGVDPVVTVNTSVDFHRIIFDRPGQAGSGCGYLPPLCTYPNGGDTVCW